LKCTLQLISLNRYLDTIISQFAQQLQLRSPSCPPLLGLCVGYGHGKIQARRLCPHGRLFDYVLHSVQIGQQASSKVQKLAYIRNLACRALRSAGKLARATHYDWHRIATRHRYRAINMVAAVMILSYNLLCGVLYLQYEINRKFEKVRNHVLMELACLFHPSRLTSCLRFPAGCAACLSDVPTMPAT